MSADGFKLVEYWRQSRSLVEAPQRKPVTSHQRNNWTHSTRGDGMTASSWRYDQCLGLGWSAWAGNVKGWLQIGLSNRVVLYSHHWPRYLRTSPRSRKQWWPRERHTHTHTRLNLSLFLKSQNELIQHVAADFFRAPSVSTSHQGEPVLIGSRASLSPTSNQQQDD